LYFAGQKHDRQHRAKAGVGEGTNKYSEGVKASGDLKGAESLGLFLKVKCGFRK